MVDPDYSDVQFIRGFILYKLYTYHYWVRPKGRPLGHTSVKNIPKGYPRLDLRGKVEAEIDSLRKMGLVSTFKHAGDAELHVSDVLDAKCIEQGLPICNFYAEAVGLPALDRRLMPIE